jgi:tRNA modification GTPase
VNIDDTICALATAPGRAGIAVIRVSGPESFRLIGGLFVPSGGPRGSLPERRPVLGRIVDREGIELDQALVTWFPAPRSYTGEDVVEISAHGSPVVAAAILDLLAGGGARIAEPGEFTMRGFLRGRIDLASAEAVRDLIESRTLFQLQVAARQRGGEMARQIAPIQRLLIDVIVQLESAVEFVEDDLALESRAALARKIESARADVRDWIASYVRGRIIREGFSLALVGRPNVGKSSLFNALLAEERSIVTELPGTTRDLVSESTSLEGIPVRLVDTAGLRASSDRVEQLGVDRSYRAIVDADALLWVVDRSVPRSGDEAALAERLAGLPAIVAFNKADLDSAWSESEVRQLPAGRPSVEVSALTGRGIDPLRKMIICHLFGGSPERDGFVVTNLRHRHCLERTEQALGRAAEALAASLSEEFALADLHAALGALGEITGETTVEELLGEIFSRFCIGK